MFRGWRAAAFALGILVLGAVTGMPEENDRPDPASPPSASIPMTFFDIKGLAKVTTSDHDTLLLLNKIQRETGEVAVRLKTLRVEGDQDAGVVVRYQDPRNFYVVVVSAKDESCALERVEDGKTKRIGAQDIPVSPLAWHELRVLFVQNRFTALLDGELVLGLKDSAFKKAGRIGLWSRAGSSILFDNFRISRS